MERLLLNEGPSGQHIVLPSVVLNLKDTTLRDQCAQVEAVYRDVAITYKSIAEEITTLKDRNIEQAQKSLEMSRLLERAKEVIAILKDIRELYSDLLRGFKKKSSDDKHHSF